MILKHSKNKRPDLFHNIQLGLVTLRISLWSLLGNSECLLIVRLVVKVYVYSITVELAFSPPEKKLLTGATSVPFTLTVSWKIKGLAGAPFLLIWIKSSSCTCNHNAFLVLVGIDETVRAWCLRLNKSSVLSWLDLLWIVIKVIKNGLSQWGGCLSWLKL